MEQKQDLTQWQTKQHTELWKKGDVEVTTTRYEGDTSFTSLSSKGDMEFDDIDSPEKMTAQGWKLGETEVEVIELVPNDTYFSVTDQILELSKLGPLNHDEVRGLVKRLIHLEKYSMYHKFQQWLTYHGQEFVSEEILPAKIKTHQNLSRVDVIRLGQGHTTND